MVEQGVHVSCPISRPQVNHEVGDVPIAEGEVYDVRVELLHDLLRLRGEHPRAEMVEEP